MAFLAALQPAQQHADTARSAARRQRVQHHPPLPSAAIGRRRLLSGAVPLLWLPWRGCDQGGSYSTGVAGSHGDGCQEIYQPAAAAEKRFAERQRQQAAAASQTPAEQQLPAQQQGQQQAAASAQVPPQPAASGREEVATLRKELAAYERQAMEAEQEERTRAFVDAMWQSLE